MTEFEKACERQRDYFERPGIEGKTRTHMTEYYNLDVIISVGYRAKSQRGVEFRKWANKVLKEYIVRGYTVNERRLTQLGVW